MSVLQTNQSSYKEKRAMSNIQAWIKSGASERIKQSLEKPVKHLIQFRVSEEMVKDLNTIAKHLKMTRSKLINAILVSALLDRGKLKK